MIGLVFVALIAACAMVATAAQAPPQVAHGISARPIFTDHVSTVPAKPAAVRTAATAVPDRSIAEELGKKFCIGGTLCADHCRDAGNSCEARPIYSLRLDRRASISRIELHADDPVGLTRAAELVVKLDGRQIGKFLVEWKGSTINVPVGRVGQSITIESRDPRGIRFAGEEAVISDIHVFGH